MSEIILYPTETVYGLGVNVFDTDALDALFALKGRDRNQSVSWLVRNIADIEQYASLGTLGAKIAEQFLPGPLTLILKAHESVPKECISADGTVGFRISNDVAAQKLIEKYMEQHDAPLTCTSANVHGCPTLQTPEEILQQFGKKASMITQVVDGGPRKNLASTIVRVVDDAVEILREGDIGSQEILDVAS